ncbi:unnamed protein product [Parascedosporium putredinis]|uniref:Ankyrin n=1 Tax=Parascedosporium putredinis TaxID=1442378 RepID=A0A9P1MDK9_9PEZI|nr:unnamed protein product [Parascedosporium putredinis]CAI8003892.1 unnamed protein product [Parascedosporium putredinis]
MTTSPPTRRPPRLRRLVRHPRRRLPRPPLTRHPFFRTRGGGNVADPVISPELYAIHADIFNRFFDAIAARNSDRSTALIAAVDLGNPAVVRHLVSLGADVAQLGRYAGAERTPLQVAAAKGLLSLVKFFMEECGADDAVIAPDGQIALRLAAKGTEHAKLMSRARRAARGIVRFCVFVAWDIPTFLLYTVPKHAVVLPLKRNIKWAIEHRHLFGPWCKRQILAIPNYAKRGARAVGRVLKEIPEIIADKAAVAIGSWLAKTARRFGAAVGHVFAQIFSVLHTMLAAIVSFFRQITLKDVWDGFYRLMRAIFVGLPKAIWAGIKAIGQTSYDVLAALFGFVGKAIWWIIWLFWQAIQFVPIMIATIFMSFVRSIGTAFREVMVWFNPKMA